MEVWGSRAKLCALYSRFNFVTPRGGHTCQVEEPPELGWVHHWAQRSDQSSRGALEEELPERKNGSDLPEVTAVPSALWRFSVVPGRPVRLELSVLKVPPPPRSLSQITPGRSAGQGALLSHQSRSNLAKEKRGVQKHLSPCWRKSILLNQACWNKMRLHVFQRIRAAFVCRTVKRVNSWYGPGLA